jgi:hypothetical protein
MMSEKSTVPSIPDIVADFMASQRRVPEDGYSEKATAESLAGFQRYERLIALHRAKPEQGDGR